MQSELRGCNHGRNNGARHDSFMIVIRKLMLLPIAMSISDVVYDQNNLPPLRTLRIWRPSPIGQYGGRLP